MGDIPSLDEFLKNDRGCFIGKLLDGNDGSSELTTELKYYIKYPSKVTNAIIQGLVDKILKFIDETDNFIEFQTWDYELLTIINLSELDDNVLINIANKINKFILDKFEFELKKQSPNFLEIMKYLIIYYKERGKIFQEFKSIGWYEYELNILKNIYINNYKMFLKSMENNIGIMRDYILIVEAYYFNLDKLEYVEKNYDDFYYSLLHNIINLSKAENHHMLLSESIYKLSKIKYSKKKYRGYLLDFSCGYGEKPLRLLRLFGIWHIVFLILYLLPWIQLGGLETGNVMERIMNIVYFNNTTMLTIGYGDISPENWIAKLFVMIEQILGFSTGGAFITLYLRKLFRY